MTSVRGTQTRNAAGDGDDDGTVSPWRGTKPELVTAGVLVAAAAVAGYLMAGWTGLSVVVIAAAAISLLVLRALLPQLTPDQAKRARGKPTARTLSGYSQAVAHGDPGRRAHRLPAGHPPGRIGRLP